MKDNSPNKVVETKYTKEEVLKCIDILEDLVNNTAQLGCYTKEERVALLKAAGYLSRPNKTEFQKRKNQIKKVKKKIVEQHQRSVRAATGIRSARHFPVFSAPLQITDQSAENEAKKLKLIKSRACYVCKTDFTDVHFFYDAMCPKCAEFNYAKRFQTTSLAGQVALITGSRLKIGYQASLMMLRAGAHVIATTRFPVDSAIRYAKEDDFHQWHDRLHIYGLDLRHTPSVELFCNYIEAKYDRLDILVNNAAQTVRRPPGFYAHLMANEMKNYSELSEDVQKLLRPFEECKRKLSVNIQTNSKELATRKLDWNGITPGIGLSSSAALSQVPYAHDHTLSTEDVFPKGKLDADLQQVDLREMNSWRLSLGEIQTSEMIELQLVNAIAPFVLCNKLSWMMKRDNTGKKHIVNVSAMEGKFHRFTKTDKHPHTNMAKAALNMLTHTSAKDLVKYGIHMNAVDTGWVTDEDPITFSLRKQEHLDFQPPLDIVDGAARVCDPFFDGIIRGEHWCGRFLKDYFPVSW